MSKRRRFRIRNTSRPILALVSALSLSIAACGGGGSGGGGAGSGASGGNTGSVADGSTGQQNPSGGGTSGGTGGTGGSTGNTGSAGGTTGGGTDNGQVVTPTTPKIFAGVVRSADAAVPATTVVCADRNGDLACGSDEEQAVVDAQGAFRFQANVADASATPSWPLVAVVPVTAGDGLAAGSARTHYSLAASADATVIDAISTLQWAGAQAPVQASGLDLHSASDARAVRVRGLLHPALVQTVAMLGDQSPTTAEPELTRTAATSLAKVAPGYVDPGTGLFLRTVTARTLRAEAVQEQIGVAGACTHEAIPTFDIVTAGNAPIVSKDNYLQATLTVSGAGLTTTTYPKTQIRGRGNSTWDLDKKPYRLKLDKAAALLGLPAEKDWVLLANHIDKTLLRNDLSFCMGRLLGFDFTPASRHVEVTLNGDYVGVYQLTEQIETGPHRVDIDEDENQTDPAALAFLLEIDWRRDEEFTFLSAHDNVPYMVKTDTTATQAPLIENYVNSLETALYDSRLLDENDGYGRWLDASTLIDMYLVNELSRNGDAFTASAYAWRAGQGLLKFGPLWDFDIAYGNANYTNPTTGLLVDETAQGWWANQFGYIQRLLAADPDFRRHVAARWAFLRGRLAGLQTFIDDGAQHLDAAQGRNFSRWPILNQTIAVNHVIHGGTYAGEVDFLHTWLNDRATWLDDAFRAEGFPARPGN
ncbi:MAG: CotH kinase family protein [Burkholderiaceae bacterium]